MSQYQVILGQKLANPGLFWSKQDSEGGKAVSLLLNITLEVGVSCPSGRWAAGPDDGQRRRIGQEAPT